MDTRDRSSRPRSGARASAGLVVVCALALSGAWPALARASCPTDDVDDGRDPASAALGRLVADHLIEEKVPVHPSCIDIATLASSVERHRLAILDGGEVEAADTVVIDGSDHRTCTYGSPPAERPVPGTREKTSEALGSALSAALKGWETWASKDLKFEYEALSAGIVRRLCESRRRAPADPGEVERKAVEREADRERVRRHARMARARAMRHLVVGFDHCEPGDQSYIEDDLIVKALSPASSRAALGTASISLQTGYAAEANAERRTTDDGDTGSRSSADAEVLVSYRQLTRATPADQDAAVLEDCANEPDPVYVKSTPWRTRLFALDETIEGWRKSLSYAEPGAYLRVAVGPSMSRGDRGIGGESVDDRDRRLATRVYELVLHEVHGGGGLWSTLRSVLPEGRGR